MVANGLPRDLDGILDPTEAFSPLGYVIDIPRHELSAFDPQATPVRMNSQPEEGTVVPWLRERHGRRPFVQLDNGDRALLDTGSGLGLAIRESGQSDRESGASVRDIGGGNISARRIAARTISIGSLTLKENSHRCSFWRRGRCAGAAWLERPAAVSPSIRSRSSANRNRAQRKQPFVTEPGAVATGL